jgi:hypothetical protein
MIVLLIYAHRLSGVPLFDFDFRKGATYSFVLELPDEGESEAERG